MNKQRKQQNINMKRRVLFTLLLVLLAIASVSLVTMAWFSLGDNTKLYSMNMDVTSGLSLRFDLDPHDLFTQYVQVLNFEQVATRVQRDLGVNAFNMELIPVTTSNGTVFTKENGDIVNVSSGQYLQYTLHFMALDDMLVHLTSANPTKGEGVGTIVYSDNIQTPYALRIAFTTDGTTYVYDPGMGDTSYTSGNMKTFGLPPSDEMVFNDFNAMFSLKANENKPVIVTVWLEGNDEACRNNIKFSNFSIALRFEGTDFENNPLQ